MRTFASQKDDLLPCPFCGSHAIRDSDEVHTWWTVEC